MILISVWSVQKSRTPFVFSGLLHAVDFYSNAKYTVAVDASDQIDRSNRTGRKPSSNTGSRGLSMRERSCGFAYDSATLHPAVRKICGLIIEHLLERWTLDSAARIAALNASYFSELFHRETGLCFREYIERCRIERARYLLVETRMQISKIAEAVGYEDIGRLERAFKRLENVSPKRFRTLYTPSLFDRDVS